MLILTPLRTGSTDSENIAMRRVRFGLELSGIVGVVYCAKVILGVQARWYLSALLRKPAVFIYEEDDVG